MSHYDDFEEAEHDRRQWDSVERPAHYNQYPVEVIEITQHLNFCRGNVVKYVARAAFKGTELEDLKKAQWYLNKEIERLQDCEANVKASKMPPLPPSPWVSEEYVCHWINAGETTDKSNTVADLIGKCKRG